MTTTVTVDLPGRPYDVHVGRGLLDHLGATIAAVTDAARVLVVTQAPVATHYLAQVEAALTADGFEVHLATVPDGEIAKSPETLLELWADCAEIPLERRDAVLALGGGVVGDLAGFLAATWNRGIDVVQVPTTVLAQTDAAIGGKTGIDLPAGKNLVGAFHQPATVVADVDTLATLSDRVRIEGLGEVVKYGLIRDPSILDLLEEQAVAIRTGDLAVLEEVVRRSVAVKAAVVAADEREAGVRAHLNLGHTYGHALETLTGYESYLHGEAVALGLLVALHLGHRMGFNGEDLTDRVADLLQRLGLPTRAPTLPRDELFDVMARDKKAHDGIRYVLLETLGRPTLVHPDPGQLDAAIAAVEGA